MTCGGCVGGVTRALEKVEGVASVTVTLDNGLATIKGTASTPALISAIEATGKKAVGCACNCGPGCACVAGECGCAAGACACDPSSCAKTTLGQHVATYGTVHLLLAAACGALVGIIVGKKLL